MKKLAFSLFYLMFPALALASSDSSLTFNPPPSDTSVVFLGNIFGIVDGVLHGSGSQIMGNMFGVFNSAVLALGGIIIMYTLLVSTMNTAQEGQMLGQKWSSIWVPMRSTLGLALLIPKASGYCLMQIFVMWVVVQGVGAADKIWGAALSYLNRGGVIIQSQVNLKDPTSALLGKNGPAEIGAGASAILAGQVCMLGIQTALQTQRQSYLRNDSIVCSGTPSPAMKSFCDNPVPDFLSTVNPVAVQNNTKGSSYTVDMPNFNNNSPYYALNGICGKINWNALASTDSIKKIQGISNNELKTANLSRAIAIQQMYVDLSSVAQIMVNNSPALKPQQSNPSINSQAPVSSVAEQQFGIPLLASGQPCTADDTKCVMWGQDSSNNSAPLFSGSEFQGAITDYNGVMMPTLKLIEQSQKADDATNNRKFIQDANKNGWILAGSYFFDLARLNSANTSTPDTSDKNTGLRNSTFDVSVLSSTFSNGQCAGKYATLCQWMNKDNRKIDSIVSLLDGSRLPDATRMNLPTFSTDDVKPSGKVQASTVYGFINNSSLVTLPGQPGLQPPKFAMKFNIDFKPGLLSLQEADFPCGRLMFVCVGRMLGNLFYNTIIRNLLNVFLDFIQQIVNVIVIHLLSIPLLGIAEIFKNGVSVIQQPTVNPIVALANMGVNYINFANELWITIIAITATPIIAVIFMLVMFILPLVLAWLAVMVSIGFVTAYYVPFLPYMIFTFGSIAWLVSVIEAMVAAPIVALGVTHPEGHDAFGKGEQAIMILMNVFLRPAMMIIGYIGAIALAYVSVWIINAGFAHVLTFLQGDPNGDTWNYTNNYKLGGSVADSANNMNPNGYAGWAGIYGFFFSILIYTTMYLTVVQKAFTLITYLPDKVLRWIGGQPESIGQEAASWGDESKKQVEGAQQKTDQAAGQRDAKLGGYVGKGIGAIKGGGSGGSASAEGGGGAESTPSAPPV